MGIEKRTFQFGKVIVDDSVLQQKSTEYIHGLLHWHGELGKTMPDGSFESFGGGFYGSPKCVVNTNSERTRTTMRFE